jgi:hypothetical protein
MKMNFMLGLLLLAATATLAAPPEAIQRVTLDERVVVTVPVSTNRVTTISFPGPIAAIDAVGVTADGKSTGQFQLAHTKGSSFVSVRALARKAATNLNIRWNKRTYVFELVESDAPVLALNLEDRAAADNPVQSVINTAQEIAKFVPPSSRSAVAGLRRTGQMICPSTRIRRELRATPASSKRLDFWEAELATVTFIQRNPKEFDHAELLRQMFLTT